MSRVNAALHALNRGEVSRIALTRVDAERLRLSAQCQVNWMPFVLGPAMLRAGLGHVGGVYGDAACQLIDFFFAKGDDALIELTANQARVWIDDALISRVAVSTAVSDPNFAGGGTWSTADTTAGCSATITGGVLTLSCSARGGLARASQAISVAGADQATEHGLRIVVSNGPVTLRAGSSMGLSDYLGETVLDTGTHSLALVPVGGTINLQIESTDARAKTLTQVTIEGAGVMTLPTPFGESDLDNLRWVSSGDVIYIGCYGRQQYKIERRGTRPGARGWSFVKYRSNNGPFQAAPSADLTLTPSVMEGNGTLTASKPLFTLAHVGALFRLFSAGQSNRATLGAANAFTEPLRVSGIGNDRKFGWDVTGSWIGRLTLQRSVVGPDSGFVDVNNTTINALVAADDSGSFNNVVCWYRVGFKNGDYTSGSATIEFGQNTAGASGASVSRTVNAENQFTTALETTSANREFVCMIDGRGSPFSGIMTVQRSTTSAVAGFSDFATILLFAPSRTILNLDDTEIFASTWWRAGCKTGEYVSGSASVSLERRGAGGVGGSPTNGAAALAGGRYGICRVTGYTSPTEVSIEVIEPFSSLIPTPNWQESEWSDAAGWPSAPSFAEGRLFWFGAKVWGSQSNNYTGYGAADAYGNSFGDAGAIVESFGEGPVDRINWGLSLSRLLCGRESAIASIRSSSFDEPLTPTNFAVKDCSEQTADRLPAVKVGKRGVFVSGSKVYELTFASQLMDYDSRDLTRLNADIGAPGFVDVAIGIKPDKTIFLPRSEGQVACLLYDPNDEVEAWWRLMTLGVVERARKLPATDGKEDRIYFIVRRTINGQTRRFIEKLSARDSCVGGSINKLLDSHVVYSGAPATSITAAHLPNTLLSVWADGAYIGTGTTDLSGVLSPLPDGLAHSDIVAGLTGAVVTAQADAGATIGGIATGLWDYEGFPCEVFADQQPSGRMKHVGTLTVSGGAIALPNGWQATSIVACFGYVAPFMSAKLAYAAQMGAPLTQKKILSHVGLVLYDAGAQSLKIGQRMDDLDDLPEIEGEDDVPETQVWSEYDEPMIPVAGEWDTDARLCLLAQAPHPVKVGGVVLQVKTNEKNAQG
jgi:hypothetical protein